MKNAKNHLIETLSVDYQVCYDDKVVFTFSTLREALSYLDGYPTSDSRWSLVKVSRKKMVFNPDYNY